MLFQPADLSLRVSDEIQGNILAGFNKDFQEFILLRFDDIGQGQRWCAALCRLGIATTRQVATFNAEFSRQRQARDGQDPPDLTAEWINVAFTFAGVDLLAPALDLAHSDRMRQVFPAFRDGPAKRADRLGDIDESGPEGWTFGNDRPTIHAIVTVAADREPDLARTLAKLKEEVGADWEAAVHCEHGRADEMKGREHFGFRDGVSQPAVAGFHIPDETDVEDTPLVDSNEFVLGLGPEGDPNREWTEPWMRGGSFQVFRRLVQDVAGWRRRIKDWHEALGRPETPSEALLEARLIGRWRDGTPLAHAPGDKDLPLQDGARRKALHFRDDPDGERTPRTAHIRRMYPRNDRRFRDSKRRIIRRGITFGPPLPDGAEGAEGEGADRGLLFSAFMASIEGQFEYLQKAWANNPYFPGSVLGDRPDHAKEGVDPVIGSDPYPDRDGSLQSPMRGVSEHRPPSFERFVRTNGALYAFAPSLSTIRLLAEGALKE